MISCTRRIQFCAGHRVMGHENKCAHLHGHNYVALITATAEELDTVGRIIDFAVLKERIGGWIESNWDHGFILWQFDSDARTLLQGWTPSHGVPQKVSVLPNNPTAENMAEYLFHTVCPNELAGTGVEVIRVELWETENCRAEARY